MRSGLATLAVAATLASLSCAAAAQPAVTATYTYDALGRLATAAYSNGLTTTYSYDAAGNRTSKTVVATKLILIIVGGGPVVAIPAP